jgi:hypothetical protein
MAIIGEYILFRKPMLRCIAADALTMGYREHSVYPLPVLGCGSTYKIEEGWRGQVSKYVMLTIRMLSA